MAVIGYCVWPYVLGQAHRKVEGEKSELLDFAVQLLHPQLRSPAERDPFQSIGLMDTSRRGAAPFRGRTGNLKGKTVPPGSFLTGKGGIFDRALSLAGSSPPSDSPDEADEAGENLRLWATSVQGPKRLALIGDRLYRPGEILQTSAGGDDQPWVVADIFTDRVILRCGKKTKELKFSDNVRAKVEQAKNMESGTAEEDTKALINAGLPSSGSDNTSAGFSGKAKKSGKKTEKSS